MKKRLPIILLLAAAAAARLVLWRTRHVRTTGNRILVSGNLELTQVDLSFKIAGRMTERKVDEGDWVKKGELIARLDPVQLRQQKVRDQAIVVQRAIELSSSSKRPSHFRKRRSKATSRRATRS